MNVPQIVPRLTDRTKAPRSWWWPDYVREEASARTTQEKSEDASAHFDQACLTIRRVMLAIVVYSCFCLFTLATPDKDLLENKIVVPFANVEVNFFDFTIVGPAILVGLTIYLQIFVGYWRANKSRAGNPNHPFVFNMDGAVPRTLTNFLFYWLPPLVLAAFAYKVDPYSESSLLPVLTLLAVASMMFLQIRRFQAKLRRSVAYRGVWVLFAFLFTFTILVAANRVANVEFGDSTDKASDALKAVGLAAMDMIGIEFVRVAQVGSVESVRGEATAKRADGKRVPLLSQDPVFERDTIETGPSGSVDIVFLDETAFSLGPNSTIVLDEIALGGADSVASQLVLQSGTFSFVTGKVPGALPLRTLDLNSQDLTETSLDRSNLREANLAKSDLSGVYLTGRDLRSAVLDGANLKGTSLGNANLANARLVQALLTGATLSNATLENADLSGAELADADLRAANLRGTVLTGTDLLGTDFGGADLRGADLTAATNLTQAQLDQACGDNETKLPVGLQIKTCGGFVPYTIKTPVGTLGVRG